MRQALAKGIVPKLHLSRFIAFLAHPSMGFFGKTSLIGLPKIAEITTAFVGIWNLVATATHSGLQSALMGLLNTKDYSIYFQHSGPTGSSVFFRSGKVATLLLIQLTTVCGATQKVHSSPRILICS